MTYSSFSSYNPTIALDVIRNEEGCDLKAYRCSAGVWTIGYGHTAGVTEGMAISQAHARDVWLRTSKRRSRSGNSSRLSRCRSTSEI